MLAVVPAGLPLGRLTCGSPSPCRSTTSAVWPPPLQHHGHEVVAVCSGGDELALRLAQLPAELAVVAATPEHLTPRLVESADLLGVRMLIVADDAAARRHAERTGIVDVSDGPADWYLLAAAAPRGEAESASVADADAAAPAPRPLAAARRPGAVVAVWGPHGAPGRTSLAIALAAEFAAAGLRVVLADADTHAASVAPALGLLDEAPGFAAACRLAGIGGLDETPVRAHRPAASLVAASVPGAHRHRSRRAAGPNWATSASRGCSRRAGECSTCSSSMSRPASNRTRSSRATSPPRGATPRRSRRCAPPTACVAIAAADPGRARAVPARPRRARRARRSGAGGDRRQQGAGERDRAQPAVAQVRQTLARFGGIDDAGADPVGSGRLRRGAARRPRARRCRAAIARPDRRSASSARATGAERGGGGRTKAPRAAASLGACPRSPSSCSPTAGRRRPTSSGCICWSPTGSCSPTSRSPTSCSGFRPTHGQLRRRRPLAPVSPRRRCSTATSSGRRSSPSGGRRSPRPSRPCRSSTPPRPTGTRRPRPGCARCRCCGGLAPSGAATTTTPIAVLTRHSNLSEARTPSRQELTFNQCANDLFAMIATRRLPRSRARRRGPRRGAPRASDGLIRLDVDGIVTFASPNGLSAFNRMGFAGELEGESLAEVTTDAAQRQARSSTSRCRSWSPAARRGAPTSRRAASR